MWPFSTLKRIDRLLEALIPHSELMHYARIGSIAVGWAHLEKSLDIVNSMILHPAGGKAIQNDLPVSLKSKIAFWKAAHSRLEPLKSIRQRGAVLIAEVVRLKDKRHDCIHGFARTADPDGTRQMERMVYLGDILDVKVTPYTVDEMRELNREIARLALLVVRHARCIARRCSEQVREGDG